MPDISASKELTTLVVLSVCVILIIGLYIIPQASYIGETNLVDLPVNNGSTDEQRITGFNGSEVGINGVMIQNNSIEIDAENIIESHTSYLSGKSRELVSNRPDSKDIYKVFGSRVVVSKGQDKTPYIYENREYQFRRQSEGENNTYSIYDEGLIDTSYDITDDIKSVLGNMTPDKLINTSDGVLIQLSPDNTTQEFRDEYNSSSSVANSSIKISDKGYVKSYSVSFESNNILSTLKRYKFTISQVGSVDVFEPDWVRQAKRTNLVANTTVNQEKSWIEIEHLAFREIPKGSNLSILTSQGLVESEVPSRISPGDILYVVAKDSKTWEVKTSNPNPGNLQFNGAEFIIEISDGSKVIYSELIQPTT